METLREKDVKRVEARLNDFLNSCNTIPINISLNLGFKKSYSILETDIKLYTNFLPLAFSEEFLNSIMHTNLNDFLKKQVIEKLKKIKDKIDFDIKKLEASINL